MKATVPTIPTHRRRHTAPATAPTMMNGEEEVGSVVVEGGTGDVETVGGEGREEVRGRGEEVASSGVVEGKMEL